MGQKPKRSNGHGKKPARIHMNMQGTGTKQPVRESIFSSPLFFRISLGIFAAEALWIALSGAYSMAFDENTHLGIIRLYAGRWLPFWSAQPDGADGLGAVYRDPSYFYHYLMSFPYRLFAHFVHAEMAQVIFLRLFSICLFIGGILLFRRVLANTGVSKRVLNVVFALFILTPVAPFLAGQMNYDNMLFAAAGAALLFTQQLVGYIRKKRRLHVKTLLLLLIVCAFGSVVKYAFLPLLAGVSIYLTFVFVNLFKEQGWKKLWADSRTQFAAMGVPLKTALSVALIIAAGLFAERYAVNTYRYHTPTPECDQVIGVDRCLNYGPWRRNYLTRQDKVKGILAPLPRNPVNYSIKMWGKRITNELFFTVDGTSSNFMTRDPLRITRYLSIAVILSGLILFMRWQRELRRRYDLNLLVTVTCVYVALLWTQNYMDFLHLGFPFAIQGRYLIPVLPIIYLCFALGFNRLLQARPGLKPVLAWAAIAVLITQGGGAGIFILKSEPSWNWPNHVVITVNNAARTFLNYFTVGS